MSDTTLKLARITIPPAFMVHYLQILYNLLDVNSLISWYNVA